MKINRIKAHTILELVHPDNDLFSVEWDGSDPAFVRIRCGLNSYVRCDLASVCQMLDEIRRAAMQELGKQ